MNSSIVCLVFSLFVMCDNNLSEAARLYALEVLNETEVNRLRCLDNLRIWLKEEVPHVRAREEDEYLLPFLRGCKFDLAKTKRKIVNYYSMKRDRPEWFAGRDPLHPLTQELVKLGVFVPLKQLHDNKMVIIVRTAGHDPKRHKWDDVIKAGQMILDVACLECPQAQIFGIIAIFDMAHMGFAHYKSMTPYLIGKLVHAWQNYHVRPKQLEFIDSPIYINVALKIFKGFMTEKMRNRVRVHFGNVEKAQEIVSKDILPADYGGNGESVETLGRYWLDKLAEYRDWFEEDAKYKAL